VSRRGVGRARIALIRRICGMMRRMLLEQEEFHWMQPSNFERKLKRYENHSGAGLPILGRFETQQNVKSPRIWWERVEPRMHMLFFPFHKQFFQDFHKFRNIVFRDEPYPFYKDFSVFVSEYMSLPYYLPPGNLGMFILK